ncbi:PLP-dependent transferase [Mycena olivaceomarginata]|nr:PLP-dependent transferase [Mycena olivaceomarginata]
MSEKHSAPVDLSHCPPTQALGTSPPDDLINMDGGQPDTSPIESITDVVPHGPGVLGWIANVLTGKGSKTTEAPTAQFCCPTSCPRIQPGYGAPSNGWKTLIDIGSSSAWMSSITILLNPGDSYLCDSALLQGSVKDLLPVAVATDQDGLSAVDLERVLTSWDSKARGSSRPRVIYTQGGIQNPTGLLISAQRKKDIYDVAVRHDLIIIEDDPYYFQQAGAHYGSGAAPKKQTDEEWLDGLVPSFLRFDYEGRVLRLDTFSKSIGPGGRLGYYTGQKLFLDKLAAHHRNEISFPSGISQALIGELLHRYEAEGFTRWLRGLTAQYELRRNWAIDALNKALDIKPKDSWSRTLTAYARPTGQMSEKFTKTTSLLSFVPPDGGMFLWLHIHLHNHPRYKALARQTSPAAAKNQLSTELWTSIYKSGVLFRRGELFAVEDDEERAKAGEEDVFLRVSFSGGPKENLEKGMQRFATTLVKFFEV